MKVLVAVKRVIDFATRIQVKADQTGVETNNVKMSMNPFDEIAVEEAIRLKEKNIAKEVIAISIGSTHNQETLRTALAMGADRAILIETDQEIQPLAAAKILQAIVLRELPQLVLLGKQAIDSDDNQVGQMLAGLLNWPQATFASEVVIHLQQHILEVTREVDGGLETLRLTIPAVVTSDLRLNQPRYLSLPNIVQAKRKSIQVIPLQELSIDIKPRIEILKISAPEKHRTGIKVNTVAELVEKLRTEAKVIE